LINGAVTFDDFSIRRLSCLADFEKPVNRQEFTGSSSDALLALGSHRSNGTLWGVSARLQTYRVQQLFLQNLTAEGVLPGLWNMANEERRQKAHDDYLQGLCADSRGKTAHHGPNLIWQFGWGTVSSTLDLKGVQALIVVTYMI
jgi:hypothetical protein